MNQINSGYHDCPCRDCFEIAIGCDDDDNPDLCGDCAVAGCSPDGDSDCDVPVCPECNTPPTFCTDGKWHANCDGDCVNAGVAWKE